MQQSNSSTQRSQPTTTAQPTQAKRETRSLLRVQMYHTIRRKMDELQVGYGKLAKLTGIDKVQLRKSLCEFPERKLSLDRLLAVLYALGYDVEVRLTPRVISPKESKYIAANKQQCKTIQPDVPSCEATNFPVRMVEFAGPNRREEETTVSSSSYA